MHLAGERRATSILDVTKLTGNSGSAVSTGLVNSAGTSTNLAAADHVHIALPIVVYVQETSAITQATATPAQMGSMTITPTIAGTYLITYTGDITQNTANKLTTMSLYVGGSQVTTSLQLFDAAGAANQSNGCFCCRAVVALNGSQAVQGYWVTTTANTATNNYRVLTAQLIHS